MFNLLSKFNTIIRKREGWLRKNIFINIPIIIFIGCISYYFYLEFNVEYFFWGKLVSFIVSFLISSWVFNKFKYYDFFIIRWLQKLVIFSICVIIVNLIFIFICSYLGIYYFNIFADSDDEYTSTLPPVKRMWFIAITSFITASATTVVSGFGTSLVKKSNILNTIKEGKHSNPVVSKIPSPSPEFINSPNEYGIFGSPIEDLLYYSLVLNVFIFILVMFLLIIIFNRFVLKSNLNLLLSFVYKYMSNKFNVLFKKYVNYSNVYSDRNLLIMFIVISIVLIFINLLSILISAELFVNTDKYIEVYNYIQNKKNMLLFFISLSNKDILVNNCFDNNDNNKCPNWIKILLKIIITIGIFMYALKVETILYYFSFFFYYIL